MVTVDQKILVGGGEGTVWQRTVLPTFRGSISRFKYMGMTASRISEASASQSNFSLPKRTKPEPIFYIIESVRVSNPVLSVNLYIFVSLLLRA